MVSINTTMIAGNLTRAPELRNVGEKSVANFSLALNHRYKGKDGETKEEVTFVDVEAWGKTAELAAQYLEKGSSCFVEGRLKLESWEDKEGKKRSRLKVVADNIQFLSSKNKPADGETAEPAPAQRASRSVVPATIGGGGTDQDPPFHSDLGADAWG
jgi:single-strand DNA-binding protein